MNSKRFLTALLAGATLFAGCSGSDGGAQYLTVDETNADYIEASQLLGLPSGVSFAAPANVGVAEDGNEVLYESGTGRNDARYYWYCAWATEATEADNPAEALANMERVESMELWDALETVSSTGRRPKDSHHV